MSKYSAGSDDDDAIAAKDGMARASQHAQRARAIGDDWRVEFEHRVIDIHLATLDDQEQEPRADPRS